MNEIWLDMEESIECCISNLGRIYRKERRTLAMRGGTEFSLVIPGKFLVGTKLSTKGYPRINIGKRTYSVHRLVAKYFLPNYHNLPQVNHIDGNKLNNAVSNLEWVSNQENRDHALRLGLHAVGEDYKSAVFKEQDIRDIRFLSTLGISQARISRIYNCGQQTVSKVVRRETWKHVD